MDDTDETDEDDSATDNAELYDYNEYDNHVDGEDVSVNKKS